MASGVVSVHRGISIVYRDTWGRLRAAEAKSGGYTLDGLGGNAFRVLSRMRGDLDGPA